MPVATTNVGDGRVVVGIEIAGGERPQGPKLVHSAQRTVSMRQGASCVMLLVLQQCSVDAVIEQSCCKQRRRHGVRQLQRVTVHGCEGLSATAGHLVPLWVEGCLVEDTNIATTHTHPSMSCCQPDSANRLVTRVPARVPNAAHTTSASTLVLVCQLSMSLSDTTQPAQFNEAQLLPTTFASSL
jgi:hypothetical protein